MNRQSLWITGAAVLVVVLIFGLFGGRGDMALHDSATRPSDTMTEDAPSGVPEDRTELGAVDGDTPPASAASEIGTDVATGVARDGEPGAAIESRDEALAASEAAGTVGAVEALTVDGYDPVLVEAVLSTADLPPDMRDRYRTRLEAADGDAELSEVLAELRGELGVRSN